MGLLGSAVGNADRNATGNTQKRKEEEKSDKNILVLLTVKTEQRRWSGLHSCRQQVFSNWR